MLFGNVLKPLLKNEVVEGLMVLWGNLMPVLKAEALPLGQVSILETVTGFQSWETFLSGWETKVSCFAWNIF